MEQERSIRNISKRLNRSVSTISEEIKNNRVNGIYDPKKANHKSYVNRHNASFRGRKITRNPKLRSFVEKNLLDNQSPEAISGRIKYHEKYLPDISKDLVYKYIKQYEALIGLKKKKRYIFKSKRNKLSDRTFIDKRPKSIENRAKIGDCETDFICPGRNGKGVLLTVVCRKIRAIFLELIKDVSIDEVHKALFKIKKRFPEMKSLTMDNDILFRMHKTLAKLLNVKIYFCHPYHSWEKGSIENVNKFIRKYIPKGSDLSKYDSKFIKILERKGNDRFMKCLDYSTPQEKLEQHRKNKKTAKKLN